MFKEIKNQKGFTLIELAIVLTVIAIITGGILAGREMITNARMNSSVSSYNEINTATMIYRQRTGDFPGDIQSSSVGDEIDNVWSELRDENVLNDGLDSNTNPTYPSGGTLSIIKTQGISGLGRASLCFEDPNDDFIAYASNEFNNRLRNESGTVVENSDQLENNRMCVGL